MKVAVTSSDGEHVDTNYNSAKKVFVFNVNNHDLMAVEKRETNVRFSPFHKQRHGWSTFECFYEVIKDCEILITRKIEPIPVQRFNSFGIRVQQTEGNIKDLLAI